MASPLRHPDLVVVGAGVVGLAHAVDAVSRGLSVRIIDRDAHAVGASVRNFGHIGVSIQTGMASDVALAGRSRWLTLAQQAGFWAAETGSVVIARAEDELSVLKEFSAARDGFAELLDAGQLRDRIAVRGEGVIGGAWLPQDLRVDPLRAAPAVADWLSRQPGVEISWGTSLIAVISDGILTNRGTIRAERVVVCVGHDVDQVFPSIAAEAGVRRCRLHMLEVDSPHGAMFSPAVLSGLSLLRYPAFSDCPSAHAVRTRVRGEHPELLEAEINLMFTQRPDGSLVIGDSHEYHPTVPPFAVESLDDLLLAQMSALLGASELRVRRRWQGIYASSEQDFLIAAPAPHVRVVSVTTGIGMTTALGLAPHVLNELLSSHPFRASSAEENR